jgi:hypothetical protein
MKVTDHAIHRASERLGWNEKALGNTAEKAWDQGIKHSDTSGSLNRYLTKLFFTYRKADNIRIHGEVIFVFCQDTLVTVYLLPSEYKKVVQKIRDRQSSIV